MNQRFRLHHANPEIFAKCESVYGEINGVRFITATPEQRRIISLTGADGMKNWATLWISDDKKVVGGMLMKQAAICRLFFVPDFTERQEACTWLVDQLDALNAREETLSLYDLSLNEVTLFEGLGYVKEKERMGMFLKREIGALEEKRQSHAFYVVGLEDKPPLKELVDFHVTTFSGGVDALFYHQSFGVMPNNEVYKRELMEWVEQLELKKTNPSVCVREVDTNRLIGVCLVGEEDGISTLFSVGVLPPYQNKGIGRWMIQESLNRLFINEEICQLYVTIGNPAIHLYKKIGFKENCVFAKMVKNA